MGAGAISPPFFMERILDINPLTGMAVTFQYDHANEQFIIAHRQDATPVIEDNKWKLLDLDAHKREAKNDWAHYAKIPEIVIMEWRQKFGVDFYDPNHWTRVLKLLEDPEYKYLKRTTYKHDR